jgi:hypothetical protein
MLNENCTMPTFAKASAGKNGKNHATPPTAGTQPPFIAGPLGLIYNNPALYIA